MRLTDNVRLTSGIIVAGRRAQHEEARDSQTCDTIWLIDIDRERCTNDKNGDDQRPSVRRLYFLHESVI